MGIKDVFASVANVLTGGVVDKAMGMIDKLIPDKDLAMNIKAQLETLKVVHEHELDVGLQALEKARLESETAIQLAQQTTFQAEVNQSDIYTKQTRPKIARTSFYISAVYGISCFVSDFIVKMVQTFSHPSTPEAITFLGTLHGITFQWEIYIAIASPALTYMGVRSLDVWKSGGAKKV